MSNCFITTSKYQDNTSTLAQQYEGAVVVSCAVFINSDGNLSTTRSASTVDETQGLKLVEWHSNDDYIDSETEKSFSTSGIMVEANVYVISGNFYNDVEILNKNPNLNVWVIEKDGALKFQPKP